MQAITVKYLAPTNTKGPRYKARCAAGTIIVNGSDKYTDYNYRKAAKELCKKLNWDCDMVGGTAYDGTEVFVLKFGEF